MFAGIKSIRPGHYMAFSESGQRGKAYWDFDYPVSTVHYEAKDEQRYVEELEGILTDSIRLRLNADVPVGFYLSGGLDSSLIGSLSKKINKGRSYPAFSIQFPDPVN
ncbi:MAG: asparagine synthase-related protein, partial [Flammeovirgaceae bacterium]